VHPRSLLDFLRIEGERVSYPVIDPFLERESYFFPRITEVRSYKRRKERPVVQFGESSSKGKKGGGWWEGEQRELKQILRLPIYWGRTLSQRAFAGAVPVSVRSNLRESNTPERAFETGRGEGY